ncbi:MAG: hypothetical protein ACYCOU_01450 [Sulfobacillus sp.]
MGNGYAISKGLSSARKQKLSEITAARTKFDYVRFEAELARISLGDLKTLDALLASKIDFSLDPPARFHLTVKELREVVSSDFIADWLRAPRGTFEYLDVYSKYDDCLARLGYALLSPLLNGYHFPHIGLDRIVVQLHSDCEPTPKSEKLQEKKRFDEDYARRMEPEARAMADLVVAELPKNLATALSGAKNSSVCYDLNSFYPGRREVFEYMSKVHRHSVRLTKEVSKLMGVKCPLMYGSRIYIDLQEEASCC